MRRLDDAEIQAVCQPADYANGCDYAAQGKVSDTWQEENGLHAAVAGSGQAPYRVSIADRDGKLAPSCTCPAHRRRPFCKHVAAVLMAWSKTPERFVAGQAPAAARPKSHTSRAAGEKAAGDEAPDTASPKSRVPRAAKDKVAAGEVQAEGLTKVEELLLELGTFGLLSLTEAQVERVDDLAHAAESHKLRRLARLVARLGKTLGTARAKKEQFTEAAYAALLSDAWLTAQATRRALDDPQADPTALEELVGKTWRDKDLEQRQDACLLELAYETVHLETGFTVDTSFLLNLADGVLYTEKQIVPTRLKSQRRKPSYSGRLEGRIGLYPGAPPRRIKLLEMAPEAAASEADWQRAAAYAERTIAALFRHFQAATGTPLGPGEDYVLLAPERIWIDAPAVRLLDGEGLALLATGCRPLIGQLTRQPVAAIFGRLVPAGGTLNLEVLSLIAAGPGAELIRLGG